MINRIVIVEDEKLNTDRLKRLINEIKPEAVIAATLESISEAMDWFGKNEKPDAIMMDIRLSDGLSFEILNNIKLDCPIIFTTAYDEYAVQAFKYNSVDYLLKPIEKDELAIALKKVEDIDAAFSNQQSIESLLKYVQQKEYRTRFLIPYRDGYKTITVNEVACIYVELKNCKARLLNGGDILLSQSMEELEQQLDPKIFFRANRQYIININVVKHVVNYFNGKLKVILNDIDFEIVVSRDKSNLLKGWLDR